MDLTAAGAHLLFPAKAFPFCGVLTRCCWLCCRRPVNSISPTAMNRGQLLSMQTGLEQFKMWLIGEDKLSCYKAQGIAF